nr:DUF2190 family protein [uncultured Actinotalea sp.]
MATNEVLRNADHITLPVPSGTVAGDPVKVGSLVGVAQTSRDSDGNATVWRKGAYDLTVSDAVTAVGTPLYVAGDGTSRITALTTTATSNTLFGYALATKGATSGPLTVVIAQV